MISRCYSLVLVALMSLSASADILFSNLLPGNSGGRISGMDTSFSGSIITFTNPGTYDIKSLDTKFYFGNNSGSLSNMTALVTLYANPDPLNTTNVFGSVPIASNLFTIPTTTGLGRPVNFDFAAVNQVSRFTDKMGVTIQLYRNGAVDPSLGLWLWSGTNAPPSSSYLDFDSNGSLSQSDLSPFNNPQWQVNGFAVTAVPEPSSLALLGLLGAVGIVIHRFHRNPFLKHLIAAFSPLACLFFCKKRACSIELE